MRAQPIKTGLSSATVTGRDVMRAIVQDVYGSAERLRLSEIENLTLQPTRSLCGSVRRVWTGARVI
jgi:hypothetical protein